MKKFILISSFLGAILSTMGQDMDSKDKNTKGHHFGMHFTAYDFQSGSILKEKGLSGLFAGNEWNNFSNLNIGLGFSYMKGLSNLSDLQVNFDFASVLNSIPSNGYKKEKILLDAHAAVLLKLLDDSHKVSPYLLGGIGAFRWDLAFGAYIPLGMGLQFKADDNSMVQLQVQDRLPVTTSTSSNHLFYSLGFTWKLSDRKKKTASPPPPPPPPPAPAPPADTDGDGVADVADQCPNAAGLSNLGGCPDTDKDGIADKDDACPNNAGIASLKGCPDADGDGIADKDDVCPNLAGIAKYNGCPDSDSDEIPDNEDNCPTIAGTPENAGCPALEFNPNNVEFLVTSSTLTKKAKQELDKLVSILNEKYPNIKLQIEGHTDASGNDESNKKLSDDRANAVKEYLIQHHVDGSRLNAIGFGSANPIADNNTVAGKQKNRRVEFKVVK